MFPFPKPVSPILNKGLGLLREPFQQCQRAGSESLKEGSERAWGRGTSRYKGPDAGPCGVMERTPARPGPGRACRPLGREGRGRVFTCALSLSSSLQGSLPQLPPADVMAAPALSWCLSLLALLLALAVPWVSTAENGESPDIWTAVLSLRDEARAFLEPSRDPCFLAEGPSSGAEAGRRKTGAMRPEIKCPSLPFALRPAPLYPLASPSHRKMLAFQPCPASARLRRTYRLWGSVSLSEMGPLTPFLPARVASLLVW